MEAMIHQGRYLVIPTETELVITEEMAALLEGASGNYWAKKNAVEP